MGNAIAIIEMLVKRSIDAVREGLSDETGATAVEYGIMVALIAAVIVAVVVTLGQEIRNAFQAVLDAITA